MLRVVRVLFGFAVACLVAGAVTVAFIVTPADLAALAPEARADRLGYAGLLALRAATQSAIFAVFPIPFALLAIGFAEWYAIRSWIYYAVCGVAIAVGGFAALYSQEAGGYDTILNDYALRAYLTVGLLGGLAYWLVAGRRAGGRRADPDSSKEQVADPDADGEPPSGKDVVAEAAN
jgi:hypothetical protein